MDLLAAAAYVMIGTEMFGLVWIDGCEWPGVERPLMHLYTHDYAGEIPEQRGCWEYQGDRIILHLPGRTLSVPRDQERVKPSSDPVPCLSCGSELSLRHRPATGRAPSTS